MRGRASRYLWGRPSAGKLAPDVLLLETGAGLSRPEPEQRVRERDRGKRFEGGPLPPLRTCERLAVLASAQMRTQAALLLSRQAVVELPRNRELRVVAGQGALELLAERLAGMGDLRVQRVTQHCERIAVDVTDVFPVEALAHSLLPPGEHRAHAQRMPRNAAPCA